MTRIIPDPLADGIQDFAHRLRRGEITCAAQTDRYLARIDALDGSLGAYEHVATGQAQRQAHAIDQLIHCGVDLGPLMGVPVSIKDIFAVDGMPTSAGSNVDVADVIGAEGPFIKRLKRAGCVILGKVKTVEFALGSSGTNYSRGTPRNPWDAQDFRLVSGSSSGSAVAVAAGLCTFSIGSDTGGSIRGPAAFCGVVGAKTTAGLWPLEGVFPLSRTFDSIGPLAASAQDAALITAALTDQPMPKPACLAGLRLGRLTPLFDDADAVVVKCIDAALQDLEGHGAQIIEVSLPQVAAANDVFTTISRPELIAALGPKRFHAIRDRMNVDVADRAAPGLTVTADAYIKAVWQHRELCEFGRAAMREVDAWIAPSKSRLPPIFPGAFVSLEKDRELTSLCAGPTRVASTFGLCAMSLPVQKYGAPLPVGMQVMCGPLNEMRMLSIALAIEQVIDRPRRPDVARFLESSSSAPREAQGQGTT
jgi:aspartyl-tRNA(Asn)/glutamyl-tRNA(Gln) amidotransferase subunit A